MKNWRDAVVKKTASIRNVVEVIDRAALQIALIVSESGELIGTVTDGDIRRGILNGISLEDRVERIMYKTPSVGRTNSAQEEILSLMKRKELRQIPIVDEHGVLVGLESLVDLVRKDSLPNHVVLMAGGLGTRLHPLTVDCPKPMLKIGSRPILETIITNFIDYGLEHFYISVNYQSKKIKDYFGNGESLGIQIEYIEETKRLGTAGALSLISKTLKHPFFVMNGDILTKVNFRHLLDFHIEHQSAGTMCVREYDFQVPYGVVNIDETKITEIIEKPVHSFFVNAGIYVLNPSVLPMIPQNAFFDMPELFKVLSENQVDTTAFPIREYWMDIGQMEDFQKANGDFSSIFNS
jgi:dTDP-glucose pyrophosphorylase/predicted transcriptional regulator